MRSYWHIATDSFEQFRDKVDIAENLVSPPVSIALIETNYQQNGGLGKRAAREIVQSTTYFIVGLIIFSTSLFVFSHYLFSRWPNLFSALSVLVFVLYLLLSAFGKWLLRFPRGASILSSDYREWNSHVDRMRHRFLSRSKDKEEQDTVNQFFDCDKSGKDMYRRRLAIVLASREKERKTSLVDAIITNVPFSFRNLWLWSLIIGLCALFVKKDYQVALAGQINNQPFQEFVSDFLRILLIAIVAYIATNVINELLQLREQYVQGKGEMASLNVGIVSALRGLEKVRDDTEDITNNLYFIGETEKIRTALISLRDHLSKGVSRHPVDTTFANFLVTIKDQFEVFDGKVTGNDIVDLWMLSSLNQYFKIASQEFQTNCWLTTRFQFFGKILNATFEPLLQNESFLKEFTANYEIFTVLVLPPERFLNYQVGGEVDPESDPAWDELIRFTIEAKRKGLQVNRHFLSLDFEQDLEPLVKGEFGEESIDLRKSKFISELKREHWFSEAESTDSSHWIKKDSDGRRYLEASATDPQEGYVATPLRTILDSIHYDGACKVMELRIPHFTGGDTEPLDKFADLLWDRKTEKTLDYFAIRERKSQDWLFCYRTVYDKTFDFAEIEILYRQQENQAKWHDLCNHLNRVFLTSQAPDGRGVTQDEQLGISIHPIKSYGSEEGDKGNESE